MGEHQYLVASCCFDRKTRIFDMRDKQVVKTLTNHEDDIIGIDYSTKTQMLATGSDDGQIYFYDGRKGWDLHGRIDTKRDASKEDNEVKRVSFSGADCSDTFLAAAGSTGGVFVYDATSVN